MCSDYVTGALAAVHLDTRAVTPYVEPTGADAVVRWHDGLVWVVNRFGADNLQAIDPTSGATVRQFSTGNGSNPQDVAFVSPVKAYVSLYESATLLIVNPATGAVTGGISLAPFADADGLPEAARMVRVDTRVFVALQRLDRNAGFQPENPSWIAVVDATADTLLDADPALPGKQAIVLAARNPVSTFAFDRGASRLLVACAGRYGVADGGIEAVDPVGLASLGVVAGEAALGGDVLDVAWHAAGHSYAVVSDAAFNTSLVAWSAVTGGALGSVYAPGGFSLSDAEVNDRGEVWVANSSFLAPGLYVFRAGADTLLAGPLDCGLPPFSLAFDQDAGTVLDAPRAAPVGTLLAGPWPNPARGAARFALTLPVAGEAAVEVFDAAGRRVATLARGALAAGRHDVAWDLKDGAGSPVPPGVYVVSARSGAARAARRVAIVR
uniref:FlgD/Vpr Ig-like domain-containing protein n=1 Tax=Eiseniibacteriota bacterium TaxID=2212470 RepID=A0A832I386_UNCEI